MKDRVTAGILSGALGAVAMNALSLFSYYVLHFTRMRNFDLMAVAVMGRPSRGLGAAAAALLYDFVFASAAGGVFALAAPVLGDAYLLGKGAYWGVIVSLWALAITTLFRVPHLLLIPYQTILSHFVEAATWGLTMAYTYQHLRPEGASGATGPTG